MRRLILLTLLAATISCAKRAPGLADAPKPQAIRFYAGVDAESARHLRAGEYLSDRYMRKLLDSRSPAACSTDPEPCLTWVQQNEDCSTQVSVGDFYSSLGWLFVKEDGWVETYNKAYVEGRFALRAGDEDHFVISFGRFEELHFQYVGDPGQWATGLLLPDEGRTADGLPFRLLPEGGLQLGPLAFAFRPCLDFRSYRQDCLWLDECQYATTFGGSGLRILEVLRDPSDEDVGEPEIESATPAGSR